MSKEFLLWIPSITYIFVIGEALALLFGMVLTKQQSAWNTRKNQTILILDIVLGWSTFLILMMNQTGLLILIPNVILMLSHAYRVVETYLKVEMPFCFNQPLSIINLVKFVGLAISIYIFI